MTTGENCAVKPRAKADHGLHFGAQGTLYDEVRPGYPAEALELLGRGWQNRAVVDLGAGTGILSRELRNRGAHVTAVDPDAEALLRNPAHRCEAGTAESTNLADSSADIVTVAQAWHWFDEAAAGVEIARILRPEGSLLILINQLDVRVDWVLRLSRIMHAGDVYRPEFRPRPGHGLTLVDHRVIEFTTPIDVDGIVSLAKTRSYWLRSNQQTRAKVEANIREYFTLEHPVTSALELPYLCLAYHLRRDD